MSENETKPLITATQDNANDSKDVVHEIEVNPNVYTSVRQNGYVEQSYEQTYNKTSDNGQLHNRDINIHEAMHDDSKLLVDTTHQNQVKQGTQTLTEKKLKKKISIVSHGNVDDKNNNSKNDHNVNNSYNNNNINNNNSKNDHNVNNSYNNNNINNNNNAEHLLLDSKTDVNNNGTEKLSDGDSSVTLTTSISTINNAVQDGSIEENTVSNITSAEQNIEYNNQTDVDSTNGVLLSARRKKSKTTNLDESISQITLKSVGRSKSLELNGSDIVDKENNDKDGNNKKGAWETKRKLSENISGVQLVDDDKKNIENNNSSELLKQRTITPFFLKQVDISDDIIKVDPKLTKGLSLVSLDSSPFRQGRKQRGESMVSNESAGSAYSRSSSSAESTSSNVRVVVRVRPLSSNEKQRGDKDILEFPGEGGIWVENGLNQTKPFTFNAVFKETCSQEVVFEESGIKGLIDKALDGFSCTTFAFGQTGSGKTYTITGPPDQSAEDMLTQGGFNGMVPRSFIYLFDAIKQRSSMNYFVKASFLEVYNEKVKDLLHPSNIVDSLPLRWSRKSGFYVDNLFTVECETVEELMEVLIKGSTYRQVGVHAMNDHSSRSHSMLTVYVDSEEIDTDEDTNGFIISKQGKISFVDLAGSEKVKETKTTGETFVESNNINKSLLTLGNCISGLGDPRKRGQHIPYRESKLTKLLADSLGGEGFTLMIACISPSSHVLQDTMNTLRYANRAKNIKNKPVVKMDPKEQLLQRMKREVKLLKAENNYFREQLGVPCSESQIIITPNQIKGELTPNGSGTLSPAIGTGTFSSIESSRNNSSKDLSDKEDVFTPRATTALYALGAKNGLYNMLQEYMNENESLKSENMELHRTRAVAQRQQEEMFRENDRLAKKLDNLGRVMLSTPLSREHVRTWMSGGSPGYGIMTDDRMSVENGSVKSHQSDTVRFPPVRQGTHPNYVNNTNATNEMEHEQERLLERERMRVEDLRQSTSDKVQHSIPNENEAYRDDPSKAYNEYEHPKDKVAKKDVELASSYNKDTKEDTKQKKSPQSKPWRIKKKAISNEKPSGYAAKFAVRKNLLSKQSVNTKQTAQRQQDVSSHSHEQTYVSVQQQQNMYMNPSPLVFPQQPYPNTMFHRNAVTQQSYASPFSQSGYYSYNGGVQPYGLSVQQPFQDYNQQLQQDLQSLTGQIHEELTPKKTRPKR